MATVDYSNIKSVLMVCMGNICRSPTAEAVFRAKVKESGLKIEIDSAGTLGAHAREKPDPRAIKAGHDRGYSFDGIRARKVSPRDFDKFDLLLAMDRDNLRDLRDIATSTTMHKAMLFLNFAQNVEDSEVPDPYYGGAGGFKYVLDLVENASDGLIEKIQA